MQERVEGLALSRLVAVRNTWAGLRVSNSSNVTITEPWVAINGKCGIVLASVRGFSIDGGLVRSRRTGCFLCCMRRGLPSQLCSVLLCCAVLWSCAGCALMVSGTAIAGQTQRLHRAGWTLPRGAVARHSRRSCAWHADHWERRQRGGLRGSQRLLRGCRMYPCVVQGQGVGAPVRGLYYSQRQLYRARGPSDGVGGACVGRSSRGRHGLEAACTC